MGKGTHFIGQPMYNQALKLLDKSKILRISREKGGERYAKHTLTGKEDKTTEIIYYTCGNLYSDDHGYSE